MCREVLDQGCHRLVEAVSVAHSVETGSRLRHEGTHVLAVLIDRQSLEGFCDDLAAGFVVVRLRFSAEQGFLQGLHVFFVLGIRLFIGVVMQDPVHHHACVDIGGKELAEEGSVHIENGDARLGLLIIGRIFIGHGYDILYDRCHGGGVILPVGDGGFHRGCLCCGCLCRRFCLFRGGCVCGGGARTDRTHPGQAGRKSQGRCFDPLATCFSHRDSSSSFLFSVPARCLFSLPVQWFFPVLYKIKGRAEKARCRMSRTISPVFSDGISRMHPNDTIFPGTFAGVFRSEADWKGCLLCPDERPAGCAKMSLDGKAGLLYPEEKVGLLCLKGKVDKR